MFYWPPKGAATLSMAILPREQKSSHSFIKLPRTQHIAPSGEHNHRLRLLRCYLLFLMRPGVGAASVHVGGSNPGLYPAWVLGELQLRHMVNVFIAQCFFAVLLYGLASGSVASCPIFLSLGRRTILCVLLIVPSDSSSTVTFNCHTVSLAQCQRQSRRWQRLATIPKQISDRFFGCRQFLAPT